MLDNGKAPYDIILYLAPRLYTTEHKNMYGIGGCLWGWENRHILPA